MKLARGIATGITAFWRSASNRKQAAPENEEDLRGRYFDAATHYYVAARFAYFARAIPTAGNLFHHAIEMYLKGCLVQTHDEGRRRRLGHNLRRIWRRFKRQVDNDNLRRFDAAIAELDPFEDLRYPERVRGWLIHFELARQPIEASGSALRTTRRFELFLNEIDELVAMLFHHTNMNPKFFAGNLSASARALLTKDNPTGIW